MPRLIPVLIVSVPLIVSCAKRPPEPRVTPGTPHISWVVMSGDRDNPDADFVCQSDPANDCTVQASRPGAQVFSDVHVYYHGVGGETKYAGSFDVGFFEGEPASHRIQTAITVHKNESITNQSVTGIVTSTPGTYAIQFALTATLTGGQTRSIDNQISVVVK